MEILEANHRRIVLIAIIVVALVVSVLLGFTFMSRPKTPFEREQAIAEASNPRWLKVEIATRDGRRQYRDNESIFVVVHFSSAARYMYKADAADGVGRAAGSDILHISDGEMKPRNMMGIICCDAKLIGLDDEPSIPPSSASLILASGDYEVYLTSRRVFNWDTKDVNVFHPSSFEVASNMIRIRVVTNSTSSNRP